MNNNNLGKELYQEAQNFFEGKGGYPKNFKKGMAKLREAALAENQDAAGEYAEYLVKNKKYAEALEFYKINYTHDFFPDEYVYCLFKRALQIYKKNLEEVQKFYGMGKEVDKYLDGDGYYYLACLCELATGKKDEKYLLEAAKNHSRAMPDAEYKKIGREYGVVMSLEEMDEYLEDADEDVDSFGVLKLDENAAWKIVSANLDEKKVKYNISTQAIKKLLTQKPKGILEFQKVIKIKYTCGKPYVNFEHDDPRFTTVETNSFSYPMNSSWSSMFATYLDKARQEDFREKMRNFETCDTYYNCRYRVISEYDGYLLDCCDKSAYQKTYNGVTYTIKEQISKLKNWKMEHITLTLGENDISLSEDAVIFVPFWFFTISLGKNSTATVRVNATTGEIDTFTDNPFGQFTEYYNAKVGAMQKFSKEALKGLKKAKRKEKFKQNKWFIIHLVATLISPFIIPILGLLMFISLGVHIYFKFFKK